MKELFLIGQRLPPSTPYYAFKSSHYGPSSKQVLTDLNWAQRHGYVERQEVYGGCYSLTEQGKQAAAQAWTKLDSSQQALVTQVKQQYNLLPLNALLQLVYTSYPEFTDKSLIRGEILGNPDDQ